MIDSRNYGNDVYVPIFRYDIVVSTPKRNDGKREKLCQL